MKKRILTTLCALSCLTCIEAQLSSNPDKFLGNISTSYQVDYGAEKYYTLWNQITGENESKWASVEGTRGSFNWSGSDRLYNYANQHSFPFKFHTLVWGAQFPSWLKNLSADERYAAIVNWMDAVKKHYPNLALIDVVNEAVEGHQPDTHYISEALGGAGETGYDWIIKAFELAYERWPNAILIYNDFNTFQWNTDQYIDIVRTLRDAGAPIDAYGCQSHDLTGCSAATLKASMSKIQNALKMPMYITEYDIGESDDTKQLNDYKAQLPLLWEADYCAGVTLWGYIYGHTWTTDGNSGLIREGKDSSGRTVYTDRPAMTWLREYMAGDAAKSAKSPFPGMKKEASLYVKPSAIRVTKGQPMSIRVRAALRTKSIQSVSLYSNGVLVGEKAAADGTPSDNTTAFDFEYTPAAKGKYSLRAVLTATDGTTYERLSSITAFNERKAYKTVSLPGTIQFENFDRGGEGYTFHDSDATNSGSTSYRTDGEGVDIVTGNGGYAIGYTSVGEWLEYTVNIAEGGIYSYEAVASCGNSDGGGFTLSLMDGSKATTLCNVAVPQTDNGTWSTYKTIKGGIAIPLEAGQYTLRATITKANCNLDKITLKRVDANADPNFHIYLCFGQSNMEGNAQWEAVDADVDARFQMLATTSFDSPKRTQGEWYTANCPIVSPAGKLGMADYFGRTMVAAMPSDVKIGVVAVAMGGSPIEMFDKDKYAQKLADNPNEWWATLAKRYYGGNPYGRLVEMARLAQQSGVIKGILLHQGCSNCGDPNWPSEVKKIYNDLLSDLGLVAADVPLFAGETERADMGGGCSSHNTVVAQLPSLIPTAHVVSSSGIPGNGVDAWHFSAAGYRTFGKRYAISALRAMGREPLADADYAMPATLADFYTLTSLSGETQQVRAGVSQQVCVWGTFADGHREELSVDATFTSDDFQIATDGTLKATREGSGIVTARYVDFIGHEHTAQFTVEAVASGVGQRFTAITQLTGGQPFAIVNEAVGKAFYGSGNQNLGFADFITAFDPAVKGYLFKLEKASGANNYLLRLIQPDGTPYTIWGNPGYLNSQVVTGNCSFILGLNNQNGQDLANGAVWTINYVNGKGFSMKNVGTGKYLSTNDAAKSTLPTYFTFCTVGTSGGTSAIETLTADAPYGDSELRDLLGRRVGDASRGLVVRGGKVVLMK
ncbi:MAG: carbohydrate-binding protein [Bacteroidales bacterium]|nr:carbohydrate-binding protein [Bacteroidales bacterium]